MSWLSWLGIKKDKPKVERRGAAPPTPGGQTLGPGARRVPFEGEVVLVQRTWRFKATSGDLSEGGVFVNTRQPPGVGSELRVFLKLDPQITLNARAKVRWIKVDKDKKVVGCGLAFEELGEETRTSVRAALDLLEAAKAAKEAATMRAPFWSRRRKAA